MKKIKKNFFSKKVKFPKIFLRLGRKKTWIKPVWLFYQSNKKNKKFS